MTRKRIIMALLVAGVAAGAIAYRAVRGGGDDDRGRDARKGAAAARWDRFATTTPPEGAGLATGGGAFAAGGRAVLGPEEERRIREVLEKLGNETAIRNAFAAGVAEPWPLPAAQGLFEDCVPIVQRGIPPGGTTDPGQICACAVRAMQEVFPREPPRPVKGNAVRIVRESYRTAINDCLNP